MNVTAFTTDAASPVLRPAPKPSAGHAAFDVAELTAADGAVTRLGLVPGQRFFQMQGRSYADAVAGAQQLAQKTGTAQAVVAAHKGLTFVVPVFLRDRSTLPSTSSRLPADLAPLAGLTPTARNGVAWAIVGATQVLDLRQLPATIGNSQG